MVRPASSSKTAASAAHTRANTAIATNTRTNYHARPERTTLSSKAVEARWVAGLVLDVPEFRGCSAYRSSPLRSLKLPYDPRSGGRERAV